MAWRKKPGKDTFDTVGTPMESPSPGSGQTAHRGTAGGDADMDQLVNIGKSIQIRGELKGNEDLMIEGKVDGKIYLKDHSLTIGANGQITAEIHAKAVTVVGEVVGNITADDKVEVASTGSMQGDICAPRVVLADGARFKGSIDMEPKSAVASSTLGTAVGKSAVGSGGATSDLPRSASTAKERQATL